MSRKVGGLLLVLVLAGGLASGATLSVPSQYATITQALAAARPGDTIEVAPAYDGTGERWPILIQIDNLTLRALPGAGLTREVVIGAKRVYDMNSGLYVPVRVKGVKVEGFTTRTPGTSWQPGIGGILIKEADEITIEGNGIGAGGIRLLDAKGCTVRGNVIERAEIGIFLERSHGNTFENNRVVDSRGLGLFLFESHGNTFNGDSYTRNADGGVVLNDSDSNTLTDLEVVGNGGWGVRLVHADWNVLSQSWIVNNTWGGVELLGSWNNRVEGNVVYNNGTAGDGSDDAQIVVTYGDKAIFTTSIFDVYGATFSEFVKLKHTISQAGENNDLLDLFVWWMTDLGVEVTELIQKLSTAIGMIDTGRTPEEIRQWIDLIIWEKHWIANPQTPSFATWSWPQVYPVWPSGVITRQFANPQTPSWTPHRPASMLDGRYNFTLQGSTNPFRVVIDEYDVNRGADFALDRNGPDNVANNADDELSWDKLNILEMILYASRMIIANNDANLDDLLQRLDALLAAGLIRESDYEPLRIKLEAALGYLRQLEAFLEGLGVLFYGMDEGLEAVQGLVATNPSLARGLLNGIKLSMEALWVSGGVFFEYFNLVELVRYKLCLVDLELPRTPDVNSILVGKKEKPFAAITGGEIDAMVASIVAALDVDPTAQAIRRAVRNDPDWDIPDIQVTRAGLRSSELNVIASNVITTDRGPSADRQIGIVIECKHNAVLNNLITNEAVQPIDSEPFYGEFHRLDYAIILLADECLIAYNAIEWVNWGIIRGGTWRRNDLQTEYVFSGFILAAYWPEPGWPEPGNPDKDRLCCRNPVTGLPTCYTRDHFEERNVAWVPTLRVSNREVTGLGFAASQRIKRNRISLNFFEHVGVTIDILDAESNTIDENLFYICANGIRFRAPGVHPWYQTPSVTIGGADANIQLLHNDFFGGVAVDNQTANQVNANANYALNASVTGNVNPPAATAPFAFANFLTITKFNILEDWARLRMGFVPEVKKFQWDGLPPNLAFFYPGVVLPAEKPRHPQDVVGTPPPPPGVPTQKSFGQGMHLLSVPVVPADASPANVFKDAVQGTEPLVLAGWNGTAYVLPTQVDTGRGYWIYLFGPRTINVSGEFPTSPYLVNLAWAGWHLVSTPKWPVAWTSVSFQLGFDVKTLAEAIGAGWIEPIAVYWQQGTGYVYIPLSASTTAAIDPWTGYWIKTLVPNLTMIIPLNQPYFPPVPTAVALAAASLPAHLQPPAPPTVTGLVSGMLTVTAYPNPVGGGQATFLASGVPVQQLRVTVLDLSGRKVWTAEAAGNQLSWNLTDSTGRTVANGVYLYYMEAKVGGLWISTKLDRLLILR